MPIEIEKKFRLTKKQHEEVLQRLPQIGARLCGEEFEENTLYEGDSLDPARSILRLRRTDKAATVTYKEGLGTSSSIEHRREEETRVEDPDAMNAILDALGFKPALVYEKRRQTWHLETTEIVVDELPFGLFMEIEGSEGNIVTAELKLGIKGLRTEPETYPQLTREHGKRYVNMIEARFDE